MYSGDRSFNRITIGAKIIYFIFCLLASHISFAQLDTIHWIPPLHFAANSEIQDHYVYLSTPVTSPFTVTIMDGSGNVLATPTISNSNPVAYTIGNGQNNNSPAFVPESNLNQVLTGKGLTLTASERFYANLRARSTNQAECLTAKGRAAFGKTFRVGGFPETKKQNNNTNRNFVVGFMATEPNTNVTISDYDPAIVFAGTFPFSAPVINFTLNEGETYVVSGYMNTTANLTGFIGALVQSDQPIVMNNGNLLGTISTNSTQDMGMDQSVPIEKLGKDYILIEGNGSSEMERPIVIAHYDNTEIYINGNATPDATINAGDFYLVPNSYYQGTGHRNMYIYTSQPAYMYQALAGSSSLATGGLNFIPPFNCYLGDSIDQISSVNKIGNTTYPDGGVMVFTKQGSTLTINGVVQTGAEPVMSVPWETYKILGISGDVSIISTAGMAAGIFGASGAAGFAGYFSGFSSNPAPSTFTYANGQDGELCVGNSTTLVADYDGIIDSLAWNFGDPSSGVNNTSTIQSPSHIFNAPGIYTVQLITYRCENDTAIKKITVSSFPIAGFSLPNTACAGGPVVFTDASSITYGKISSWKWDFGDGNTSTAQNPTHIYSTGGTYTVQQVVFSEGGACTDTIKKSILIYAKPNADFTGPAACSTDAIQFTDKSTISSGTIVSWSWNFGDGVSSSAQNPSHLYATTGIYNAQLIVVSNNSCSDTVVHAVNVNGLPDAVFTSSLNCSVDSVSFTDKSTISSGTIVSWNWNFGDGLKATSQNPTHKYASSGNYNVQLIVLSDNGCSDTVVQTIVVSSVQTAGIDKSVCIGSSVQIGSTPVVGNTYSWLPASGLSSTSIANPSANPTNTTSYTLTVTTSAGCTYTDTVIVTVNSKPTVTASATSSAICNGKNTTLTASGASTYTWTPTATLSSGSGTSVIATPTSTTAYTVTGTDANTCISTGTITITVNPNPTVTASATSSTICNGGNTTLTASGASTYTWTSAVTLSSGSGTSVTATPTSTTTYTVTGTDANTCTNTGTITVTVNPKPTVTASATSSAICNGGNTTLTGSGASTYTWASAVTLSSGSGTSVTATPTSTTTYTVTGTDANTCTNTGTITITVNPKPTVTASATSSTICNGGNTTLTASGASTYTWASAATLSSGSGTSVTATPTSNTTYTVTGTDANTCTNTATIAITVNPNPTVTASATSSAICNGGNTSLTASGASTYTWASAVTLSSGSGTSVTATPTSTTTYTVTGTDANTCTNTGTITITVNPLPNPDLGPDIWLCPGDNIQLNAHNGITYNWAPAIGLNNTTIAAPIAGPSTTTSYTVSVTDSNTCTNTDTITVTVNATVPTDAGPDKTICIGDSIQIGGAPTGPSTGNSSYSWSPSIGLSSTIVANPMASPTVTTTYTVTVLNDTCHGTDIVVITVNPLPNANAGTDQAICTGSSTTLTASGGISYTWAPSSGLSNTSISNPIASPTLTIDYIVTVTDANTCHKNDTLTIRVDPLPTTNAGSNNSICIGGSTTIGGTPTGPLNSTYTWIPTTGLNNTAIANPIATPTITTTYTVTVIDTNTCQNTGTISIRVDPLPTINAGSNTSICIGGSTTIGGTPTGPLNSAYTWIPATGLNNSTIANPVATPTITTNYTVTVIDTNTCQSIGTIKITVNPLPNANAGTDQAICTGSSTTLAASGGISYTWTPSSGLSNISIPNPIASPTLTTDYIVTVTDANTCNKNDTVTIKVNPLPMATTGNDTAICLYQNLLIGSDNIFGHTYKWTSIPPGFTSTNSKQTVTPKTSTIYILTETITATTCTKTDSIAIIVHPLPSATTGNDTSTCYGKSVIIGSDSVPGNTYSWTSVPPNFTSDNSQITVVPSDTTTYILTETITNTGCTKTDSVTINIWQLPKADAGEDIAICNGDTAYINASGTGSYRWTPSTSLNNDTIPNPIATPTVTTTYILTITDKNNCINTDTIQIQRNPLPTITIGEDRDICIGSSTTLTASGGTEYSWTPTNSLNIPTIPDPMASPTSTTTYTVIVTDTNNCSDIASVTIRVNSIPTGGFSAIYTPSCEGMLGEFTNKSIGADTYIWDFGDGSTSQEENPAHVFPYSQSYTIKQIAINNGICNDTSIATTTVSSLNDNIIATYPNVFTPNGDGINDLFQLDIKGKFRDCSSLIIYNRWGVKVSDTNVLWWDGRTTTGEEAAEGVYFYVFKIKDSFVIKGSITLLR